MEGREFGSSGNGIGRRRENIEAGIARDMLRRWRTGQAAPPDPSPHDLWIAAGGTVRSAGAVVRYIADRKVGA